MSDHNTRAAYDGIDGPERRVVAHPRPKSQSNPSYLPSPVIAGSGGGGNDGDSAVVEDWGAELRYVPALRTLPGQSGGMLVQGQISTQFRTFNRPTHNPQQRSGTRTASDGGDSSLNMRLRQSSLEERAADQSFSGSHNRTTSHKRRTEDTHDPASNTYAEMRPAKRMAEPYASNPRQNHSALSSRHNSFDSQHRNRYTNQSLTSPVQVTAGIANHYHNLPSPVQHQDVRLDSRPPLLTPTTSAISPSSECTTPLEPAIQKQPTTRPISEQQLINEVKGIYAGLVMVERKCVEIVAQQTNSTKRLENQQWKALVALHRTLLQEHHDFFSASQHPTASDALKRLAIKYAMPARMWRHGIHAFLELLRHRLPDSMEHMLSFIYLSYSMMALLKESVPSFVETWIECLGDLARYRMAIEDHDPRDREIWSNVARMWYNDAADKLPNVGRIQHHLAVLARPNIVQQLFYYTKALVSAIPFINARESIMLLFDPFLKNHDMKSRYSMAESSFVHAAAELFTRGSVSRFEASRRDYTANLSAQIDRLGSKFKVQGPEMAAALIAMLLDFGKEDSHLWALCRTDVEEEKSRRAITMDADNTKVPAEYDKHKVLEDYWSSLSDQSAVVRVNEAHMSKGDEVNDSMCTSEDVVGRAGPLFFDTMSTIALRVGDKNIVPFVHVILANLWTLAYIPGALVWIEKYIPWSQLATILNTIGRSGISYCNIENDTFPPSFGGFGKQLPEDFLLRGAITTRHYFPTDFFDNLVDEDERNVELPSHQAPRTERCLWLGVRFSSLHRYLSYDYETKQFTATEFADKINKGMIRSPQSEYGERLLI